MTQVPASSHGGGGSTFDGGMIGAEVATDTTLVTTVLTDLLFDQLFSTTTDVTLGVDDKTFTFHVTGWYVVWYSFTVKASATTVKSQVESQLLCSDSQNWLGQTSLGEVQVHLDGAASLLDCASPFTSPPVHFTAGDTVKMRATAMDTAGSVGNAIVTANTYVTIMRLY